MSVVIAPSDTVRRIVKALGLTNAVSATVDVRLNGVVTVKAEQYVEKAALDAMATVLEEREYVLVPKKDAEEAVAQLQELVDMTDPWCGSKCVVDTVTPEARRGRASFEWLRKAITGSARR